MDDEDENGVSKKELMSLLVLYKDDPATLRNMFPLLPSDAEYGDDGGDFFQLACEELDLDTMKGIVACWGEDHLNGKTYSSVYDGPWIALHCVCEQALHGTIYHSSDGRTKWMKTIRWILDQPAGLKTLNVVRTAMYWPPRYIRQSITWSPLHIVTLSDVIASILADVVHLLLQYGANPLLQTTQYGTAERMTALQFYLSEHATCDDPDEKVVHLLQSSEHAWKGALFTLRL